MCRMIAAAGRFSARAMREALLQMASNENPYYQHEMRQRGAAYRHQDGWGAAWIEEGRLRVLRRPESCLTDPELSSIDAVKTSLLVLHARRATSSNSVDLTNTHPFAETFAGRSWTFCHNGAIKDPSVLDRAPGLSPKGITDSERLFHHLLNAVAGIFPVPGSASGQAEPQDEVVAGALLRALEPVIDYSALHSFLVTEDRIYAIAQRNVEGSRPGYHSLHLGSGPACSVVSSEPVTEMGEIGWRRLHEPDVVVLRAHPGT
jgi:predicted glutamine amidotransferase